MHKSTHDSDLQHNPVEIAGPRTAVFGATFVTVPDHAGIGSQPGGFGMGIDMVGSTQTTAASGRNAGPARTCSQTRFLGPFRPVPCSPLCVRICRCYAGEQADECPGIEA
ncbi:hypothetical protein ABT072_42640 [Streptomyces sp. NPDC002589]|uniref:hypothetical protein n=1 Tax=Streptomyces sp. NPDC002589 TaxID=3154420 RepID=UPI003318A088